MLEPASSSHERPVTHAREPDTGKCPVDAVIWAARRRPQTVISGEYLLGSHIEERRCRQPVAFDLDSQSAGCMSESGDGRDMRTIVRVEIADDANPDRCRHFS